MQQLTSCDLLSGSNFRAQGGLLWALILPAARRIPQKAGSLRADGWQTGVGRDLRGRPFAIAGLGDVARAIAAIGRAFGMDVVAWSENLTAQAATEAGTRQ